jgi:hypothetical protein
VPLDRNPQTVKLFKPNLLHCPGLSISEDYGLADKFGLVWRLCGAQVPDVDRIVACLRRNTPQLSGQCRAVFEQSDDAPRRGEDRDYGQRRYDRDYGPKRYDRDYDE